MQIYTKNGLRQEQSFSAKCKDCNKEWTGQNTHPTAVRHAKAYNHEVVVNWIFTYPKT